MTFEQWWQIYLNEPHPDYPELNRHQVWLPSVQEEHKRTAKKSWDQATLESGKVWLQATRNAVSRAVQEGGKV